MSTQKTRIRAAAPLTSSFVVSDPISLRSSSYLDLALNIEAQGGVTQIEVRFEVSLDQKLPTQTPAEAVWTEVQSEVIAAGVSTPNPYTVQVPVSGPGVFGLTVPTQGQQGRVKVQASAGSEAGSSVSIDALPRLLGVKD